MYRYSKLGQCKVQSHTYTTSFNTADMSLSNILNQNSENILQHVDQMMMLWEDDRGKLLRNIHLLKRKNDSTKKMFKLLREKYDILALQLHRMKPINIENRTKGNEVTSVTTYDSSNLTSSNYSNRNNSDEGFVKINYKGKECNETVTDNTVVPTSFADSNVAALNRSSKFKSCNGNESSGVNQLNDVCNTNHKSLESMQIKPLQLSKNSTDKVLSRIDNKSSSHVNPNKSLVIDSPPSSSSSKKQKIETYTKMFSTNKNLNSSTSISNSNLGSNPVIMGQLPNKLSTLNNSHTTKNGISIQSENIHSSSSNAMPPPPPPLQISSKISIPSMPKPEKVVKYVQSVRNKSLREIMPGHTCTECNAYYDALRQQGITFNDYDMQEMLRKCSRHKQEWMAPSTPDGFWDCEVNTPDDWKK